MMVSSIHAAGTNGIRKNLTGLQEEARNIARATEKPEVEVPDVARSVTKTKQHLRGVEASSHVIEVTDRAVGHLIDVLV